MKILCATWHYPPSTEIAGKVVYRLVRALVARGHELVVVTVPDSCARQLDRDIGPELPGVRVVTVNPWPDPFEHLGRLERRLFRPVSAGGGGERTAHNRRAPRRLAAVRNFPDRANLWIPPARRMLRRLVRDERPDLLLSSSPLFSAHVAALGAHRTFPALPWWAWSHDPASGNPFTSAGGGVGERLLARLESEVVRAARGNIVTTVELADEFERRYGRRPAVLHAGFDPADAPSPVDPPPTGPMVIVHAGTLYGPRTPIPLLEAIAGLLRHGELGPDDLRVRLIGDALDLAGESPERAVERLGLRRIVSVEPPVGQREAYAALLSSHVGLVLAEGQPMQIPAKLFDYVGLRRPVLAVSDGATAALVERCHLGIVATTATLPADLRRLVHEFRRDRLRSATERMAVAAEAFTAARQAELFETAVTAPTA